MNIESCPFCHSIDTQVVLDYENHNAFVVCVDCDARGPVIEIQEIVSIPDFPERLQAAAKAKWNDRTYHLSSF